MNKTDSQTLLKVENLSLHFKTGKQVVKAVDGVSFEVKKGEVFSLVGESGCGKTTTGRTIIRLYQQTGGEIYFNGERVGAGTHSNKKLRKIQMIFQDPIASLDPRMTVREIVSEGLLINGEKDKKRIDEQVFSVLEKVGLSKEHADRYPHEFSGGQRQRIGIARAVVMRPEMIIADEPISALDVSVQAQVINLLNQLREEFGLTVLFIAHDLSVVKYFSDRIAVMYAGKIVELASSDELFKRPLHPYTQSLLSAIPLPDPYQEKKRVRLTYNPLTAHHYVEQSPSMREVFPKHFVLCNQAEEEVYKNAKTKKKTTSA